MKSSQRFLKKNWCVILNFRGFNDKVGLAGAWFLSPLPSFWSRIRWTSVLSCAPFTSTLKIVRAEILKSSLFFFFINYQLRRPCPPNAISRFSLSAMLSLSLSFPSSARKLVQTIPLSKQSQLLVLSLVLPITLLKQPENGFLDPLLTRFIPLSSSPSSYCWWYVRCWTHCCKRRLRSFFSVPASYKLILEMW